MGSDCRRLLDNRPLKFEEFNSLIDQIIYVSATPGEYEREMSGGISAEQIIRPTGLLDPVIETHSTEGQMDHLIGEINRGDGKGRESTGHDADKEDGGEPYRTISRMSV